MNMHTKRDKQLHTEIHTYTVANIVEYIYTCILTCIDTCMHKHRPAYIWRQTQIHAYLHAHSYIHTHTYVNLELISVCIVRCHMRLVCQILCRYISTLMAQESDRMQSYCASLKTTLTFDLDKSFSKKHGLCSSSKRSTLLSSLYNAIWYNALQQTKMQ